MSWANWNLKSCYLGVYNEQAFLEVVREFMIDFLVGKPFFGIRKSGGFAFVS